MNWYRALNKPLLCPPERVFVVVWPILYFMIGLSLFLFLRGGNIQTKIIPLVWFVAQILLNFAWSGVFFGMKKIGLALLVLVLLVIVLGGTIFEFWGFSRAASLLLVPYFLWCLFALYLNFEFWRLNGF